MEPSELFTLPSKNEPNVTRIYKGYAYKLDRRTSTHIYLACIKKKDKQLRCRARCTLVNGKVNETGKHNHPPDHTLEEKRKFHNALRNAARNKLGTFRECYERYSKEFPEIASKLSYPTLAKNFRRWYLQAEEEEFVDYVPNKNIKGEIEDLEYFSSVLSQNKYWLSYHVSISKERQRHCVETKLIRDGKYKHLVIFDKDLMEMICDARKIMVHKIVSVVPQKCGTHLITILFEKYEKALASCWILMGGEEEFCYQVLFKYIKILFPNFNPKQAIVDFNKGLQNGLKAAFSNIELVPSFLHFIQAVFENAMKTGTAVPMNKKKNTEKHATLRKFMALSLLPKTNFLIAFNRLIEECKRKYETEFDSFIDYFIKEWLGEWTLDGFNFYRLRDLTKNFLECYEYRMNFKIGTELTPLTLLEKLKGILISVRTNLHALERGDVLTYYLIPEEEENEKKLFKTWDRLDNDLITAHECLVICSNLLNEGFISTLPDIVIHENQVDNSERNEMYNNILPQEEEDSSLEEFLQ